MSSEPAAPARIAPAEAPYEPWIAESFAKLMPPGMEPLMLFRTLAHNPRVLQRLFAGNLLDQGSLGLRQRELLILRTCARCAAEYEWGVHVALFAAQAGLNREQIAGTLAPDAAGRWSEQETPLIRLADELHDTATVSDSVWQALAAYYSQEQIIEMIALCGYYHSISFCANAARLAPEKFAPLFSAYRDKSG